VQRLVRETERLALPFLRPRAFHVLIT
jgi:hypothetical protein